MTSPLPVPMNLRLPNDLWVQVDPDRFGLTNAAMLAVRSEHDGDGYAPTITVSGAVLGPGEGMQEAADEAVSAFEAQADDVEMIKREARGSEGSPGLMQLLGGTVAVEGRRFDVRQAQAFLGMRDVEDPEVLAVVKVVLSVTFAQLDLYLAEFQDLIASMAPTALNE